MVMGVCIGKFIKLHALHVWFSVYQWNCLQKTKKLPPTWLRTKSRINSNCSPGKKGTGWNYAWGKSQPFKYRCLIKVSSCELGFLLCFIWGLKPGSHHNQHMVAACPSLAYLRSCDYIDQKHLDQLMVTWFPYLLFSKLLSKQVNLEIAVNIFWCSCSRHKKNPCQIILVWTGLFWHEILKQASKDETTHSP